MTVSAVACLAVAGESLDDILKRANVALYEAKAEGRNLARISV
ncbi:hypothetical protein [Halomonas aquatica]|uniref:GGDEF domain-containing protein n=1 Tax=Halomonas aquatica TaxID=3151123 RepID=A0ABV1NEV7_9GAMM